MAEEVNATALLVIEIEQLKVNVDHFFTIIMSMIICFMQCGFAFLECGAVRIRNATNILFKNLMDSFVAALAYWTLGYAFANGESSNPFIGHINFFCIGLKEDSTSNFLFHYSFAATAATIVSGAVAERMQMGAYLLMSAVLTAFVYPVVSHWGWTEEGWLNQKKFQDFAGSAIVHLCGGSCALIGATILGPRHRRFEADQADGFRGHSVPPLVNMTRMFQHIALGAFILFFGFLAFNGSSVGSISAEGAGAAASRAMVVTVLAGSASAICTLLIHRQYSVNVAVNGALAGMVAACGGCNVYRLYVGLIVGALAALAYSGISKLMRFIKIDDPLDAVAVHGGGGLTGIMLVPFFDMKKGLFYVGSSKGATEVLLWNTVGAVVIMAWSMFWCALLFAPMRVLGLLRINKESEKIGMDATKHKEPAYPDLYPDKREFRKDTSPRRENGNIVKVAPINYVKSSLPIFSKTPGMYRSTLADLARNLSASSRLPSGKPVVQ